MLASELRDALKRLKKIVKSKNTIPVLDNVLFENGAVTGGDILVYATIPLPNIEGLECLVELAPLLRIIGKLKHEPITLHVDAEKLHVVTGKGTIKLPCTTPLGNYPVFSCYPKIKEPSEWVVKMLAASDVAKLKKAANFTADDTLRPMLNGVHVAPERLEASDAHVLHYPTKDESTTLEGVIIPNEATELLVEGVTYGALVGTFAGSDAAASKTVKLQGSNGEEVAFYTIEGHYPKLAGVIPSPHFELKVDLAELRAAVELAHLVTSTTDSDCLDFVPTEKGLEIKGEGEADEYSHVLNMDTEAVILELFEFNLKGRLLLDLLKLEPKTGELVFRLTSPGMIVLINNDICIMPMFKA